MKVTISIDKHAFKVLSSIANGVRLLLQGHKGSKGQIPRRRWTIARLSYAITPVIADKWFDKPNRGGPYKYTLFINEALALMEEIQAAESISHDEQKLLSALHQALINADFDSESLNMKHLTL